MSSDIVRIQDIRSEHMDKQVTVRGYITKCSEPKLRATFGIYVCQMCDSTVKVPMTRSSVVPQVCDSCKRRALKLKADESDFVDFQEAELAEVPKPRKGQLSPGVRIPVYLEGKELVNSISIGDAVQISGVIRFKVHKSDSFADRHIDVVSLEKLVK
jgi:DNA replicative helicase MCM subunit Mcm2 (Cdc46/Mcm family)